jgi:hypothetical protein
MLNIFVILLVLGFVISTMLQEPDVGIGLG